MGVAESRQVLDLIARLRARGVTVLLVSHNMDDVVAATERVVVLKRGSKIYEGATAALDAGRLAHVITSGLAPAA